MNTSRWEDIKASVLEQVDAEVWARENLEQVRRVRPDEIVALCCYHDEREPSLGINTERRVFYCQGCGTKGNLIDLYMQVNQVPFKDALVKMAQNLGIDLTNPSPTRAPQKESTAAPVIATNPPISKRKVDLWHQDLREQKIKAQWIVKHRGITRKTLTKYKIGWDGHRYTIPITDEAGEVVNVRRYDPSKQTSGKMIHLVERIDGASYKYGHPARLFGLDELVDAKQGTRIHICEGEWDRLVLAQQGWLAVTSTHGAKSWVKGWNRYFKDREVVILYDADTPGERGAQMVAQELVRVAKIVRVVKLPFDQPGLKDVTDWFVGAGRDAETLRALIDATPPTGPEPEPDESDLDFRVHGVTAFTGAPDTYVLDVDPDGRERGELKLDGDDLGSPGHFKRAYRMRFLRIPQGVPKSIDAWESIVNRWLDRAERVEMPEEASEDGALCEAIRFHLREFPVSSGLSEVHRGRPTTTSAGIVIWSPPLYKVLCHDFRGLGRKHLAQTLRSLGCESRSVRIEGTVMKVWRVPPELCQAVAGPALTLVPLPQSETPPASRDD
ncbi:MAG: hypothetical protein KJN79_00100 [Gammaproteobacteria bacterium]|nr:hypothetical protein [Gammaproteobacteria bacterium]